MSQPSKSASTTKPRPRIFRALGARELPAVIEITGQPFALIEDLKHDSWAATGLYAGAQGKVICKFNREQSILGLPMRWLGRMLAHREAEFLHRTSNVPNLPRVCDPVSVNGTVCLNASARAYVEGHPLREGEYVKDDFFPRLRLTIDGIHHCGLAHVDLHKRENIIVTDGGHPCLIDFQICWLPPPGFWGRLWSSRAILRVLQRSDLYHLTKHIIRHRPDQLPPEQRDVYWHLPWFIKLHRYALSVPFRFLRRRLLVLLSIRSGEGMAGTEVAPEDAIRREQAPDAQSPSKGDQNLPDI